MSTAVENIPAVETLVNGHSGAYHGGATNGAALANGALTWEQQFLPPALHLDDRARASQIESRLAPLVLCGAALRRVGDVFQRELEAGLRERPSSLQMENTYVPELPDGTEEGVFLALDLGGTNFRVLLLELRAGRLVREDVKHYHISDALRLGPGEELFNFLADCVQDFVRAEGMEDEEMSLGFTFSFPMKQHSISSGELITWTKSFKCSGMQGVDVAALLQRCLRERNLRVTVQVLLNDTTGTLVAGAHTDPEVAIGVILGTGSNGCYMERAERVQHWEAKHERVRDVVVDIEWGAFGDNGCLDFLRSSFDKEVDENSLLPTSFTFEKYIGGKYLGDLLCAVLRGLARDGLFPAPPAWGAVDSAHVSLFEEENLVGAWSQTSEALRAACGAPVTRHDALVAQHVARIVSNRAAQLVSVCIASILRRMNRARAAVAVDGSVFKKHPRISSLMDKYIALLAPHHQFTLQGAEDGSGKGSALTAAIAARVAARSP
ncbi:hexokinase HKDC1-like [Pararge aegeria]|uniref:Phosphotransferase n=3 Tax=Pararge aegeria TaxID=116150 RepID=A0A8S4RR10_9NEOP|nr:hexokinase HKDC1-like [Pararge aegeria]XP_039761248.1 hexokinase HKDC1-like [Pararge aegeria]XP_039761249.1 hexokinase HKDC1-like [Pararge aegeria]CAH2238666.1 jg26759 [Pararge aegeria aegeria]